MVERRRFTALALARVRARAFAENKFPRVKGETRRWNYRINQASFSSVAGAGTYRAE